MERPVTSVEVRHAKVRPIVLQQESQAVPVERDRLFQIPNAEVEVAKLCGGRERPIEIAIYSPLCRQELDGVEGLLSGADPSLRVDDLDAAGRHADAAEPLGGRKRQLDPDPVGIAQVERLGHHMIGRSKALAARDQARDEAREFRFARYVDREVIEPGASAADAAGSAGMQDEQCGSVRPELHDASGFVPHVQPHDVAPESHRRVPRHHVQVYDPVLREFGTRFCSGCCHVAAPFFQGSHSRDTLRNSTARNNSSKSQTWLSPKSRRRSLGCTADDLSKVILRIGRPANGSLHGSAISFPAMPIRVLLADDHTIVRSGVAQILNEQPDIRVVAEAADGETAIALYRRERPDVALVDLRMPKLDGVQVVEQIRREFPDAALVMLTTFDTDDDIDRALTAGAKAYLMKDVSPTDLVACVRTVRQGGTWVSPTVASKLVARMTRVQLTLRELAVLRLVAAGKSNREIGEGLNISEGTVKIHLGHLFEKLGVTSRTEAVAKAVGRGLIRFG
jgi:two-component system, NarL family, response regulator